MSPTRFQNTVKGFDPGKLDELAGRLYKLNEEKEYDKAIEEGRKLIEMSPTNLTGHKELALALKNTGKDSLSDLHFGVMVKIIKSIFMYGDGTYKWPFIVNNFFEGFSIYEAVYRSRPNKYTLMLDKHGRLLAAYNAYSSALDEFLFGTRTCRIGSHF